MGGEKEGSTIFRKPFSLTAIGALFLAICSAISANAAAPGRFLNSAEQSAAPALPPSGTYKIDPDHTFVYFGAWHQVVGLVRGRFEKVTGTITIAQDPAACGVDVTIDTSTVNTQVSERDADLRGPAFFDVKNFPTMTYHGRGIRRAAGDSWVVDGSLTIRGITVAVPLTFNFKGAIHTRPGKPIRVAFHGAAATKRADFGMTRDNRMELGVPPAPGSDVSIEIDVEADSTS